MSVSMRYAHAYGAYLNSPEWKERRREALVRADNCCEGCGVIEHLEVHHLTYDRLGFERPQDLMVLCNACHAREHGRAPTKSPVAGLSSLGRAIDAWERYDRQREQETVLARVVSHGQREAILRVAAALTELPDGPLRKKLKRFAEDHRPAIHQMRTERFHEEYPEYARELPR